MMVEGPVANWDAALAVRIARNSHSISADPTVERRRRIRVEYVRPLTVVRLARLGLPEISAVSLNLSLSGMGFICPQRLLPDERFATLLNFGGDLGRFALCRVVYSTCVSEDLFKCGCTFEESAPKHYGWTQMPARWVERARL